MNCSNCNQVIEAGAVFCGNCGQRLQTEPVGLSERTTTMPAYAFTMSDQHAGEVKALLALLFGITGIIGALFMAAVGLILGVAGIVMGTMSRSGSKRRLGTAGLILSGLAVMAGLAVWTYALKQYPSSNQVSSQSSGLSARTTAPSVLTTDLSTPCYSVDFVNKFQVSNNSDSCNMQAFNGSEVATSTDAYKIYVSQSAVTDAKVFSGIAKQAINKDVKDNLPNFSITEERTAYFAGSPAYVVTTFNKIQDVSIVEAAVLHKAGKASKVFILVHAINGQTADLNILETGWQWQ